ncbi:MAG: TraR/DksA family transcriptional regulator, partial [Gammaproteobacteria bacterium]|nr:TraR/DksA family transcriptional regulator [Gammaproteobacteria bacterium]
MNNHKHFRQLLLARRSQIESITGTGNDAAGIVELDQSRTGRLTRIDALQSQAMSQEAMRRRQVELARIQQALARIEAGEFGYCVACEEEIGVERLELDPSNP